MEEDVLMTHDELLAEIIGEGDGEIVKSTRRWHNTKALRAVVELHKPWDDTWPSDGSPLLRCGAPDCTDVFTVYPCLTIQAIEKELK